MPDWRLEKLPTLYKQLIDKKNLLKDDGMTDNELTILHELYPKFSSMCAFLSNYKIPETLDHCDFHDNNILIEKNTNHITIIDWGETVITHPFFSLVSCLNNATYRYTLKETDKAYIELQNTCLEDWLGFESKNNLLEAILLTKKLWPIYSALGFHRLMISSNAKEFKSYTDNHFTPSGRLARSFREFIKIKNKNPRSKLTGIFIFLYIISPARNKFARTATKGEHSHGSPLDKSVWNGFVTRSDPEGVKTTDGFQHSPLCKVPHQVRDMIKGFCDGLANCKQTLILPLHTTSHLLQKNSRFG